MAWAAYAAATWEGDPQVLGNAWKAGRQAAERAIRRAMADGADRVWDLREHPPDGPGRWRATPPLNIYDPLEALAGTWRTWVLKDGGEVQPPAPVPYGSSAYWAEAEEVLEIARALTAGQKRIAEDWNLDQGTVTPAGVWNLKARDLVRSRDLETLQTARVLAVLNVAMADALVAAWHAKFTYWTERPVTAIRERMDPQWLPHLLTPAFPGYVSGHAAVSGAAAEVLAAFFPDSAASLRTAAEEAALSRLYAGIHFRSDNDEGLALGRQVGRLVLERLVGPDVAAPLRARTARSLLP
jgi:membrane-associated phospholipid phosphatase